MGFGDMSKIYNTSNEALNDFVFASNMAKKVKEAARPQDSDTRNASEN